MLLKEDGAYPILNTMHKLKFTLQKNFIIRKISKQRRCMIIVFTASDYSNSFLLNDFYLVFVFGVSDTKDYRTILSLFWH
jgi:hypothetical protein